MRKRFISIFVSLALVFGFVCSSVVSYAIAPLVLVQAALASYVASTGYKLYIDNGTGEDLLNLLSDLYDDYLDVYPAAETLLELGQNNYVYTDTSGHIILTQTAASCFQGFADWIKTNYSVTVGSTSQTPVVLPSGSLYYFGDYQNVSLYANRLDFDSSRFFEVRYVGNMYLSNVTVGTYNSYPIYLCCDNPSAIMYYYFDTLSSKLAWYNGTQVQAGLYYFNGSQYVSLGMGVTTATSWVERTNVLSNVTWASDIPQCAIYSYNAPTSLVSSVAGGPGLAVSLANDIVDIVSGVTAGKSLVLDVGATAGDTAQDIASTVISGYDAVTGAIPVTDSIIATDVIDTPVQPYPDVDSLGLPQLGLALTTRFPFSIPWDISAIYSAISAPSEPPVKTFDLIPASVLARWGINANTSITIDLTDQKYSVLLAIIHWSCIVGFCFGLAVMTKRYVWTTGG